MLLNGAGIGTQRVGRSQSVFAVVQVGGFVEIEAAVHHCGVVIAIGKESGVDEGVLQEILAVKLPLDAGRRVAIDREGDAPKVMVNGCVQQDDLSSNCGGQEHRERVT